jgi:flagellar protein FlbD
MIKVTHLGGKPFFLNSDLIESVETTPDTILVLTTGKRVIVQESVEEVLRRIVEFRRSLLYPPPAAPKRTDPAGGPS